MDDRDKPVYMISVAADLAHMHPQTLRVYEQRGLVSPKRTSGNTRMYSEADIERLELINRLTHEGINLAGVLRVLDMQAEIEKRDDRITKLERQNIRVQERIHELELRTKITAIIKQDGQEITKYVEGGVVTKQLPPKKK
ncbi:MAG: MerR family transcriptional regulator [Coriobacteriales bacterium]|jgi:MerR family transcriptional regulator/heat shock protein HspR|nr:MerR family transcriptional regulator [Coriobacteriales bacterium]